jgi:hypothetical protein
MPEFTLIVDAASVSKSFHTSEQLAIVATAQLGDLQLAGLAESRMRPGRGGPGYTPSGLEGSSFVVTVDDDGNVTSIVWNR